MKIKIIRFKREYIDDIQYNVVAFANAEGGKSVVVLAIQRGTSCLYSLFFTG